MLNFQLKLFMVFSQVYHRATYSATRQPIWQWWSAYLPSACPPSECLPRGYKWNSVWPCRTPWFGCRCLGWQARRRPPLLQQPQHSNMHTRTHTLTATPTSTCISRTCRACPGVLPRPRGYLRPPPASPITSCLRIYSTHFLEVSIGHSSYRHAGVRSRDLKGGFSHFSAVTDMLQSEQMTSRMIYQIYTQRMTQEQHVYMQRISNEMVMRSVGHQPSHGPQSFSKFERPELSTSPSHLIYQFSRKLIRWAIMCLIVYCLNNRLFVYGTWNIPDFY